jgi:NitT/TauT family transport system permease protein
LITTALATLNATDMFAAITILSLVGVCLVYLLSAIERRLLHWSSEFRSD